MTKKKAIIIGAGPAGLTAAYELLKKTDIQPIIFEATKDIGGISKTVNYKGNRIDIGGHRFFSKSEKVMKFWENILPLQGAPAKDDLILNRDLPLNKENPQADPEHTDKVMLIRNRVSRIFYLRRFFSYPISLSIDTLLNLGFARIAKIGFSYIRISLFPIKNEKSLEDFFINRFGKELYRTFFKDYTEKVWGVPCEKIKPEWGAQRVKGLSITKTLMHAVKKLVPTKSNSLDQKDVETSLIERFYYPKFGPGQIWEEVAQAIKNQGGEIIQDHTVIGLEHQDNKILSLEAKDNSSGEVKTITGDYYLSTMPIKDLIKAMGESVPEKVKETAEGLQYRDFITVGLLLKKLKVNNESDIPTVNNLVPDNWIYVQERDVKVGRLQIFNNWSPYMVKDEGTVWIGLEYFCNEGDELWTMKDSDFANFAISELAKINIINEEDVLDYMVIRVPKTYPAYFGTYEDFPIVKKFVDQFKNLFLIGRNGMHRYNNMDHSMLTAMEAVDNITKGITTKDNIWQVNTEQEYHEEKAAS